MVEHTLIAKLFISGKIEVLTGLHIGGSSTTLDIGGIDLNIIKDAKGVPYIPGSSLKGKIRSLLEIKNNNGEDSYFTTDGIHVCKDPECEICNVFGRTSGNKKYFKRESDEKGNEKKVEMIFKVEEETVSRTRLVVRDANLDKEDFKNKFKELELEYSESKTENSINRLNSIAQNPRQQERVPAGAIFEYEMVLNILREKDVDYLKTLIEGMRLLEDDYLGGSGSRGYGKIKFDSIKIEIKTPLDYASDNSRREVKTYSDTNFEISELIEAVKHEIKNKGKNNAGN